MVHYNPLITQASVSCARSCNLGNLIIGPAYSVLSIGIGATGISRFRVLVSGTKMGARYGVRLGL
ncbi:hypothetical protein M441DRAFT_351792 [Trichoderma asperellum CBS 433.97]|uniref:Uncharacterized protein n=1 Tax=Trichoderma asperellum (strain ATCC 204424 / CBS 433.97 / NBRC 101777) TaxID=1042311 RepID=A0A2T3ZIE5_TRIA4|nr:hypothetical protein M441DRAFT_351792 [Trichoderma asperellum CBS 433.97]PTB44581.1 hypothetical protein M441DRAFT_351792 [Trichoderma asperellum CBS 433.97]